MKRILSILLVALMLVGMLPMQAFHAHAAEESATLSLDVASNRTSFTTSQQVWEANGIILTNNKASSSSNVANYTPPRFYASSELIIKCTLGNITKIEISCSSSSYATAMVNSANGAGATASASSNTVTITPASASDTFTISKMTAQVRCGNTLTVYYEAAASACEHTNTSTTTVDASCGVAGSTTVTCDDCGEEISKTEIPALEHNYVNGVCQNCQNKLAVVSFSVPGQIAAVGSITASESGVVTLPKATESYKGKYDYTFVGWAEKSVSATETEPTVYTAGSAYTPDGDTTLYAVYQWSEGGTGGSTEYVLTDLSAIAPTDVVVVTMTYTDGTIYALSSANGTSKAPTATTVTVTNGVLDEAPADDLKWSIGGNASGYILYVNGSTSTWLYCTGTNNGVRVGENSANTFVVDSASGYLKHKGTNRYLGVYRTTPDWRCYTNTTGNTANQTLGFYVLTSGGTTYYTSILEGAETVCQHTNTTTTTMEATCTEAGSVTVTCDDCSEVISTEVIPATGHNYESVVTKPTCIAGGYTTYTCSDCGDSYKDNETEATGEHTYVDGICSVCGEKEPTTGATAWQLVTDVSSLKAGDKIVIVAAEHDYALSTTQNNNRPAVAVIKNTANNTVEITDSVQVLTLTSGTNDGTLAFYTGSGYLYAASSTSNYLKTETILSENSSWAITIDSETGAASIVAQGSNSRNTIRYNLNNGGTTPLFSCYASGQEAVAIYKETVLCEHENTESHSQVDPSCTAVGYEAGLFCTDCKIYIEGHEEIPALGHECGEGEVTKAATCTETGIKTFTCTRCSYSYTEQINAAGHKYEETENPDGSTTYTCSVCKDSYTTEPQICYDMVTDRLTVLEGGQFVIAIQMNGEYYAMGQNLSDGALSAVKVTVNDDNQVVYVKNETPVWNAKTIDSDHISLFNGEKFLGYGNSGTSLITSESSYSWKVENGAEEDGYYVRSYAYNDRVISYVDKYSQFKAYSDNNIGANTDSEKYFFDLYFFKLAVEQGEQVTLTFKENGENITYRQTVDYNDQFNMPYNYNSVPAGYTFYGWVTLPQKESVEITTKVYKAGENYPMTSDKIFYALYTRKDDYLESEEVIYYPVKEQTELVVGEKYIIVGGDDSKYTAAANQESNARYAQEVFKNTDGTITLTKESTVAIFILEEGVTSGSFAFLDQALKQYLYCASTKDNNYLRSAAEKNQAASFFITATGDEQITSVIYADVEIDNKYIGYNESATRFSCYDQNSQASVSLFVGKPQIVAADVYTTNVCEHDYTEKTTEATCTENGKIIYTCSQCGDQYAESIPALGHKYEAEVSESGAYPVVNYKCSVCGDVGYTAELTFKATTLVLENSLIINYWTPTNVDGNEDFKGFENITVAFSYGSRESSHEGMTLSINDSAVSIGTNEEIGECYKVPCRYISPSQIGDEITAIISGSFNGTTYTYKMDNYSVKQYCLNRLAKSTSAEEKAMLVDLLHYCDASRAYTNYKADESVINSLTDTQKADHANRIANAYKAVANMKSKDIADEKATWEGAKLYLYHCVRMVFRFETQGVEANSLKAHVQIGSDTNNVQILDVVTNEGQYYVYVDELAAAEMSKEVYVTLYQGDTAVSDTICYSVESYVAAMLNDKNEKLVTLLKAMMCYGKSAETYFGTKTSE